MQISKYILQAVEDAIVQYGEVSYDNMLSRLTGHYTLSAMITYCTNVDGRDW